MLSMLSMFVLINSIGCKLQENLEQLRAEASLLAMNTYMTFSAFGENAQAALTDVKQKDRSNVIEIKDHQIHIPDADCLDHTYINMGWLDFADPIICLPNHMVIQFTDNDMATDAVA